ncbi:MAG: hypothetical protein GYA36_21005, partial [Veillonellaceae bacterium]|nr:hypothetical protein [Veillonellaceae bacterium]
MAAPLVTGTAALVAQLHPDWTGEHIAACLTGTATRDVTARNDRDGLQFPYGDFIPLLDAAAAVTCPGGPPTDRGGNDYIARSPSTGRAVRVADGQVYGIADGGVFNCLAETRVVWDIDYLDPLLQPVDSIQLTCPSAGDPWTYTPTAQGGNTGTDVILRNEAGNAWLINTAGEIQTIPDGGTYLCLAASNPVIWNVPDDKINAWTPIGTTPATCGPNTPTDDKNIVAWGGDFLSQGRVPVSPEPALAVAGGAYHSLALTADGTVVAWGDNTYGQATVPADLTGVTAIAAGWDHSLALTTDGTIIAWGDNTNGQATVPADLTGVTAIATGGYHSLALTTDGTVVAWGSDSYGATTVPADLTGVTAIAA